MGKRLFVGNLPFSTTADELRALFSQHGNVTDVHIVVDRETSRPRGFAFVSYATDEEAARATEALNGKPMGGRPLVVKDARDRGAPAPPGERPARPPGPRPGGFGGGFRGTSGPPREGPGGGPARPWGQRPPRMPVIDPAELPQEGERRRFSTKKRRPEATDADRVPKVRAREEEDVRAGNWRQWMNEYEGEEGEDQELEDAGTEHRDAGPEHDPEHDEEGQDRGGAEEK